MMETCDWCGKGKMVVGEGPYGKFLGCDQFPRCKRSKTIMSTSVDVDPDVDKIIEWYGAREPVDPDYFEGPGEFDGDEDREIERAERAYEKWLERKG